MAIRFQRSTTVALIVACALFMENLDGTVIATALPQIANSMGVEPVRLSLAITSYLLSVAIFIPASGWAADRFGTRTIFRAAIAVFAFGSILCGISGDVWQLTGARIVQGMGGAMMVPVGRLVLLRNVEKSDLVRAMALVTMPAMIGPVFGPPVGGFIVTYASWRWIFFLNIPIAILGFVLVSLLIENEKAADTPPLDVWGYVLAGTTLSGMVMGFETIGRDGVPLPAALAILGLGAAAALLYVRHARRHPHPIVDLTLFRIPTFAIAIAGGTLFRIGIGALPFLLPLMFQVGFGMTALASGMLTFVSAIGAFAMKLSARPILRLLGFRTVLIANGILSALFLMCYGAFDISTPNSVILLLLLTGGFFRSLQFTATNALVFADVPLQRMSKATSISATAQQLSQSVGIATGASILHLMLTSRGSATLAASDFLPAFLVVGLISAVSSVVFTRLARNAGSALRGRRPQPIPASAEERRKAAAD